MNKIDIVALCESFEQRSLKVEYRVPSHLRYLILMTGWHETLDRQIEDADTVGVAFF